MDANFNITKSTDGSIFEPNIHDGYLVEFAIMSSDCVYFIIENTFGNKFKFSFNKIEDIRFDIWSKEPTCFGLYIWNLLEIPNFIWDASDNPLRVLYPYLSREDVFRKINKKKEGSEGGNLVFLSCSYGGEIALLCDAVTVHKC